MGVEGEGKLDRSREPVKGSQRERAAAKDERLGTKPHPALINLRTKDTPNFVPSPPTISLLLCYLILLFTLHHLPVVSIACKHALSSHAPAIVKHDQCVSLFAANSAT
jgi:hypothetical protein